MHAQILFADCLYQSVLCQINDTKLFITCSCFIVYFYNRVSTYEKGNDHICTISSDFFLFAIKRYNIGSERQSLSVKLNVSSYP